MRAPVPANTDLPDRVAFGLTAHQLVLAAPAFALALAGVFLLAAELLPIWVVAPAEILVAAMALAAVRTNPDGEPVDRFVRAALRHRRGPRTEALAAEGPIAVPAWARDRDEPPPAPLELPWRGVDPEGFVALGPDERGVDLGHTALLRLSSLDLDLVSDDELRALVDGFGALLNALEIPIQLVVHSQPVDVTGPADELERRVELLGPDSRLGALAWARARTLRSMSSQGVLRRRVYCCLRAGDPGRLAEQAARVAEGFRRLGVRAERLGPEEVALLLGGPATGRLPGPVVGRRAS